jgi:septal ring factor EnvC (AmiA/AmiB activator)
MYQRASAIALFAVLCATTPQAQQPPAPRDAQRRVNDRMRALQQESEQLARQSETLVGELRKLEIDRDLRAQEAAQAEAAVSEARQSLERTTSRLAAVEQERQAQLPDLKKQLVDVYKRGRGGYARLLFGADGLRDFARATRAVGGLAAINERRIEEHRRTLAALAAEQSALEKTATELQARQADARRARAAADRAVAAHAALIAQIDARRDLAARYVGELQVAYDRLQQQVSATSRGDAVTVPLAPFRGALDWPATGRIAGRFGQTAGRLGGTAVRNGIEIAAAENMPVRAIHAGTVGYAEPFTGFGNLVIVEHGSGNYSLYGYLGGISVQRGDRVEAGGELGRVGLAPAGPPALYFEMRIDGRSVDPLQWLKRVP